MDKKPERYASYGCRNGVSCSHLCKLAMEFAPRIRALALPLFGACDAMLALAIISLCARSCRIYRKYVSEPGVRCQAARSEESGEPAGQHFARQASQ